jgi:curli biogenesis system outer membrane secretion channel CsgG
MIKEQGYQLANSTEATRVQIGKQLGARYMITGSITELGAETGRQVRASKQEDVYYQLTVDITDLETGIIVTRKQRDRLRRRSRPIFGW